MSEMSKFAVKIKLPVTFVNFTASYSQVDKLNGVQFMILTIASTESFRRVTWEEVMERLGIPEVIFNEMFKPALGRMIFLRMINPTNEIDYEDYVGRVTLTNIGKQAFRDGVIAKDVKSFEGTVANVPASPNIKYVKGTTVKCCDKSGFNEVRFSDLVPDEQMVENHIVKDKEKYGVDEKDAEVFDINIQVQPGIQCYESEIRLNLDEVSGHFIIDGGNLDDNLLKSKFTSQEILSQIPETLLKPSASNLQINNFSEKLPEWGSVMFYLPYDVKTDGSKLVLINGKNCSSPKYQCSDRLGDADFVSIMTSKLGYEYAGVRIPTSIDGLEGQYNIALVVRHPLDTEQIAEYVRSAAHDLRPADADTLSQALRIADIIDDRDLIEELITNCLTESANLTGLLVELRQYKKEKWYPRIPDMVEKVLLSKDSDAKSIAVILNQAEIQIAGTYLATKFKSTDEKTCLANADALGPIVRNEAVFLREMGLEQVIADTILSGTESSYNSKHLAAMSNLSKNLGSLRKLFDIKSPSEYHFDLSVFDDEKKKQIRTYLATYSTDMETIRSLVQGTDRYSEMKAYEVFFKEIRQFLDNSNASNRRSYGIEEGIRLADALERYGFSGDLDSMLANARSNKIISDEDFKLLTAFRQFRNDCAHEMTVREVKDKELRRWKQAIDNIARFEEKEEKK